MGPKSADHRHVTTAWAASFRDRRTQSLAGAGGSPD